MSEGSYVPCKHICGANCLVKLRGPTDKLAQDERPCYAFIKL